MSQKKEVKNRFSNSGYAYFAGDPSVGFPAYAYDFEIPVFDEEYREEVRAKLTALYNELDGEYSCHVVFEGERDNDPDEPKFDPYEMGGKWPKIGQ